MPKLTAPQAIELIQINRSIHNEVLKDADFYLQYKQPSGHDLINGGFHFIQANTLFLQTPLTDTSLGGFLIDYGHIVCCYLNTRQPRVNQHFILFHEIYHLLKGIDSNEAHFVSTEQSGDVSLDERKADYFASLLLMPEKEMRNFFAVIKEEKIQIQIFKAMNQFKAPFKSVLIRLLELNILLTEELFTTLFDESLDFSLLFAESGLDAFIVEPSYVLNIPDLEKVIAKNPMNEFIPESSTEKNKQLFNQLIRSLQVKGDR